MHRFCSLSFCPCPTYQIHACRAAALGVCASLQGIACASPPAALLRSQADTSLILLISTFVGVRLWSIRLYSLSLSLHYFHFVILCRLVPIDIPQGVVAYHMHTHIAISSTDCFSFLSLPLTTATSM